MRSPCRKRPLVGRDKTGVFVLTAKDLEGAGAVWQISGSHPLIGFDFFPSRQVTELERLAVAQKLERQKCLLIALNAVLRNRLSDFVPISQTGTFGCGARNQIADDPLGLDQDLRVEAELVAAQHFGGAGETWSEGARARQLGSSGKH